MWRENLKSSPLNASSSSQLLLLLSQLSSGWLRFFSRYCSWQMCTGLSHIGSLCHFILQLMLCHFKAIQHNEKCSHITKITMGDWRHREIYFLIPIAFSLPSARTLRCIFDWLKTLNLILLNLKPLENLIFSEIRYNLE